MTTTSSSRSILLALGLGLVLATACFDESVLENQDCASNADCAKSQECVRTAYQLNDTASKFGWCRPEGEGCAVGEQPGCECAANATEFTCDPLDDGTPLCPSAQETATCVCKLVQDVGGMDGDLSCPPP